jgi:hypothetical protein
METSLFQMEQQQVTSPRHLQAGCKGGNKEKKLRIQSCGTVDQIHKESKKTGGLPGGRGEAL